ncbi:MAG: helix-turn-helix transcriptional regulator [Humidesulfovibrio sp.]|uniref:helix-turn-helix transcriptional regulator n=1 Tax=Humidesulfovibrio sp. TaxID=2910988 RepID=UPI0027E7378E|nr:helix-turn-helix transcriptional regulator [Humidesulfovibrio sp.]MDQ7834105.1 helix-turn-helix transcriptional regulator [Humidesulfovibrio sp.]
MERILPGLTTLPRPVFARVETLAKPSWVREHQHQWVQLSYATRGVLGVRTRSASHLAPPQRAIWVPPGVEHSVVTTERTVMRSLYIEPKAVEGTPLQEYKDCRVLVITPLVRELIRAVTSAPVEYDEAGPDGRLVVVLLDQLARLKEARFSLPLPVDSRLERLSVRLEQHPEDERGLVELAAEAGLSTRTMTRLFLRETGLSFRAWRRRLRLLKSLNGLEAGESVTAVALDSGYASTSAFSAAFRKEFGITPREAVQNDPPQAAPRCPK